MKKVAEYKKKTVQEFHDLIKEYPVVGIVNMQNMPASGLQSMRGQLRDSVVMKMSRKTLIKLALEKGKAEKKDLEKLAEHLGGMPAFIFTKDNPFKLFKIIKKNRSKAAAKAGQIAPNDIVVKKGPTPFAPGPIIGELGQLGIKTAVEDGKVAVQDDSVVVKEGEEINDNVAAVLSRLDIKPMEIGLDLVAAYENGTVFTKKVLDVDEEEFMSNLMKAGRDAIGLALEVGYFTKDTVIMLVQKSFNESKALALSQDIMTDMFKGEILSKAAAQAASLKDKAKIDVSVKKIQEKQEEKSEEVEKPKTEEKVEEAKAEEVKSEAEEKKEPEKVEEPKAEEKQEETKEEQKIEEPEVKEAKEEKPEIKEEPKVEEKKEEAPKEKTEIKEDKAEESIKEKPVEKVETELETPKEKSIEKEEVELEKPKEKVEEEKKPEEPKVDDKVKEMVGKTKEKFEEIEKEEEKEEGIPTADKLVKDLKDHVEGKEVKAEDLIEEASQQDVDTKEVEDIVKKIQKGENPMDAPGDDVPDIHDLAKKKKKDDN